MELYHPESTRPFDIEKDNTLEYQKNDPFKILCLILIKQVVQMMRVPRFRSNPNLPQVAKLQNAEKLESQVSKQQKGQEMKNEWMKQ